MPNCVTAKSTCFRVNLWDFSWSRNKELILFSFLLVMSNSCVDDLVFLGSFVKSKGEMDIFIWFSRLISIMLIRVSRISFP